MVTVKYAPWWGEHRSQWEKTQLNCPFQYGRAHISLNWAQSALPSNELHSHTHAYAHPYRWSRKDTWQGLPNTTQMDCNRASVKCNNQHHKYSRGNLGLKSKETSSPPQCSLSLPTPMAGLSPPFAFTPGQKPSHKPAFRSASSPLPQPCSPCLLASSHECCRGFWFGSLVWRGVGQGWWYIMLELSGSL